MSDAPDLDSVAYYWTAETEYGWRETFEYTSKHLFHWKLYSAGKWHLPLMDVHANETVTHLHSANSLWGTCKLEARILECSVTQQDGDCWTWIINLYWVTHSPFSSPTPTYRKKALGQFCYPLCHHVAKLNWLRHLSSSKYDSWLAGIMQGRRPCE